MKTDSPIPDAIEYLLKSAKTKTVNLEVLVNEKRSSSISYNQRKLEKFSFSEAYQLGVRVIDGHHEGVAFTESLSRESLDQTLNEARENAKMIEKPWTSELLGEQKMPTLDRIFNPQLETVTIEQKLKAAAQLESAALDFDAGIASVESSRYADNSSTVWIANSKGLNGSYRQNSCMAGTFCLAKDGNGAVSAGDQEAERSFERLDTKKIAEVAAQKTLQRRGAIRPNTGKYTIVFENRVAETLLSLMIGYFNAKSVFEGTSPLKGKLNEEIFSAQLSVLDDPFFADGRASRPFDEEGYPSKKTTLVENGVLKSYLTNSVLARKMNLPHTASASRAPSTDLDISPTNILVRPGTSSFNDLVNADGKVIVISDILGRAGFRHASGDFSMPMEGHLYEQGQATVPLKDFLISGNILSLFAAVEGVGNDHRRPMGSVVSPSLLVHGLNVVGQS